MLADTPKTEALVQAECSIRRVDPQSHRPVRRSRFVDEPLQQGRAEASISGVGDERDVEEVQLGLGPIDAPPADVMTVQCHHGSFGMGELRLQLGLPDLELETQELVDAVVVPAERLELVAADCVVELTEERPVGLDLRA